LEAGDEREAAAASQPLDRLANGLKADALARVEQRSALKKKQLAQHLGSQVFLIA
jgi:hypothetical protein